MADSITLNSDDLKAVVFSLVEEKILEIFGDPEGDLEFSDELKARLRAQLARAASGDVGTPADEVKLRLGL